MNQKNAWSVLVVCLVLGLVTVGLYAPAFHFNFVNYDDIYVVANQHVNKGLSGAFAWAFQSGYANVWQPLTWLSHALDCAMFGALNSGAQHGTSVVLHALNSVLVFLVLRKLTGAFWRCAAVAAFFAWHPLHVEPAAWIAERKELLCAFFWLLTLWAYACYAEKSKARVASARLYYAGALVLFAFALMSKSTAVTFPLILILLDWWPLGRFASSPGQPEAKPTGFLLMEKIPFFVLSIAAVVIGAIATHANHATNAVAALPFRFRFVTAGMTCFRYIAKSLWPSDLGARYPLVHAPKLELIGIALVLVIICVVAVRNRTKRPYWLAGWLWFLVALLPVLNLLQMDAQPLADRYMYIPSIGLWMLVCWEAHDLAGLWPSGRAALGGLAVGLLAACCVLSSIQLRIWQNEGALLARIPQSNSNSRAHADFAAYLLHSGQLSQAIAECRTAISIAPAVAEYPVLLGDILLAAGKPDDAIQQFQGALRMDQTADFARVELGRGFLIKKRLSDAEGEFNAVLRNQPKNFEAQTLLAQCLLAQGKTSNAVAVYWSSLKLQPNQAETLNDLAWVLATDSHPEIRRGTNAVQLASRACELTHGQEPRFLGTLAAAWAEAGDFDKAVLAGQRAHDVATNLAQHAADPAWAQSLKMLADTNTQLVTLYRQHKPFREKK